MLSMKNAIILHGMPGKEEYYSGEYPSASNSHWLPWLQKQLLMKDIFAVTTEMPHAYEPNWEVWKREFERFYVTPETILVGHSCGGGFIVRWLSQHPEVKVGKVVLVAPWIDPTDRLKSDFFKFEINPDLAKQTDGVMIFHSDNDMDVIQESVDILKSKINHVEDKAFHNYGHFTFGDMGIDAFPELISELV